MSDGSNDDLKAKMREALDRKQAHDTGVSKDNPVKEEAARVRGRRGRRANRRDRAQGRRLVAATRRRLTSAGDR